MEYHWFPTVAPHENVRANKRKDDRNDIMVHRFLLTMELHLPKQFA